MKTTRLLDIVFNQPLIITEGAFWSVHKVIEAYLFDQAQAKREGEYCGEMVEFPGMVVDENGIAHIPIAGAIGHKLDGYDKMGGAIDVVDISAEVAEASRDPHVHALLFDIDSPGGMVNGTPELADQIAAVQKPKYSFSNGSIASGAYWLAAATDGIFGTRTAEAGSIGVLMGFLDRSKMYEEAGIKVQLIKAGKYKGMGYPGTFLTKEQTELLQERINQIYGDFTSHVTAHRPDVSTETMQGQMFLGPAAVTAGLIDDIVRSKQDVIDMLK
jgi:signal peptide peptidase SppA